MFTNRLQTVSVLPHFRNMIIIFFYCFSGALRDETGTYFASFHLIGVTMYLAAVLSFLLPYTSRRHIGT